MLYLYDHAFTNKLKKVYPRVVYAPVDEFYTRYLEVEDNKKAAIKLPAISLWRLSHEFNSYNARSHMNTPSIQRRRYSKEEYRQIYSMQIPLNYQIDIWASTDIDRDDMFTELMYFLTLYPNISIEYQGENLAFPISLESSDDVTDIAQFESTGPLYRISIPCRINDARLFFYKDIKYNKHIQIDFSGEGIDHDMIDIVPDLPKPPVN